MFWKTVQQYQTLISAGVALFAAYLAVWNVSRQLKQIRATNEEARSRKASASRSMLSMSLSQIIESQVTILSRFQQIWLSADEQKEVFDKRPEFVQNDPGLESMRSIFELIENGDKILLCYLSEIVHKIQIQKSRLKIYAPENDITQISAITRSDIVRDILDSLEIIVLLENLFDYARRKTERIPRPHLSQQEMLRVSSFYRRWHSSFSRIDEAIMANYEKSKY